MPRFSCASGHPMGSLSATGGSWPLLHCWLPVCSVACAGSSIQVEIHVSHFCGAMLLSPYLIDKVSCFNRPTSWDVPFLYLLLLREDVITDLLPWLADVWSLQTRKSWSTTRNRIQLNWYLLCRTCTRKPSRLRRSSPPQLCDSDGTWPLGPCSRVCPTCPTHSPLSKREQCQSLWFERILTKQKRRSEKGRFNGSIKSCADRFFLDAMIREL